MNSNKKMIISSVIAGTLFLSTPVKSLAVMEVHDTTLQMLNTQNNFIANLNAMIGKANAVYGQIGMTQQMYENFLNKYGLGGSKIGRYASSVLSQCISDKFASISKIFELPDFKVCGVNIMNDLANWLAHAITQQIAVILKGTGEKPKKRKKPTENDAPGTSVVTQLPDKTLTDTGMGNGDTEVTDENGKKRKIPLITDKADINGSKNYKDSLYYITNNSLIEETPGNGINAFMVKAASGDKENMGDIRAPEIDAFYGNLARHYTKVQKFHNQQFMRWTYNLKETNDFFNTTFVKNNKKEKSEDFTIDVPLPVAVVNKQRAVGSGSEKGCLLTNDEAEKKLGGCYVMGYQMSFIPARTMVENSGSYKDYTDGFRDFSRKIIKKMSKDGSKYSRILEDRYDIEKKISEIKRSKDYKESGINFASLSKLISIYADTSASLLRGSSPEGRDLIKINYLKAITYQLTLLNQQIYFYNRINSGIKAEKYEELYNHVLNIEKELVKIRRFETYYLRKILLK